MEIRKHGIIISVKFMTLMRTGTQLKLSIEVGNF